MNVNNKKIRIVCIILSALVIILGFSYAVLTYTSTSTNQELVLGDIWMKYEESNGISLENAMPGDEYIKYFEFTITGKNTYTKKDILYDIKLNYGDIPSGKIEENRIEDKYLKFRLTEVNGEDETEIFTDKTYEDLSNKVIHMSTIPKNTNDYAKTYRLYMVISEKILIGNVEGAISIDEFSNLFGSVKVSTTGDFSFLYSIDLESEDRAFDKIYYTIEDEVVLPILTRDEYIFDGWYETKDFSSEKVTKLEKGSFGNRKFYAKWKQEYTISFNINEELPDGYTLLNYIQSTGTQYIDTTFSDSEGFIGNALISFVELNGEESIIGSHNLSSPYGRNYIGTTNGGNVWEVGVGNTYKSSTTTLSVGNIYNIDFATLKNNSYLNVNGENVISVVENNVRSTNNVLIYTCQWVIHSGAPTAKMKVYQVELYNSNNEKVREFTPCINPDGIIGLYDKVENKFYENAGTGEFKYGLILPSDKLTKVVTVNEPYGELPEPEREGYNFLGWYTENGIKITSDTVVENEEQVLYAKWSKN